MTKITHHAKGITRFFRETLGAKLNNTQWSWGVRPTGCDHVFLRVWEDHIELDGNREKVQIYWKNPRNKSHGYKERREQLDAIQNGCRAIGVLCEAADKNPTGKRKIKSFDDEQLLLLGDLTEDERFKYATIVKSFPIGELQTMIGLQNSAIDDIPFPPTGSKLPDRIESSGWRYQRDEKVRSFILQQAKGTCEYCGKLGFVLPDDSRYLEAHHIISLAKQGPDTPDNVIALCPSDHREAHYGKKRIAMEHEMLEIIKKRQVTTN